MKWPLSQPLAQALLVAVVYYALGQVTTLLRPDHEVIWLFWPPTGLALAAVLLGGIRVLPGIALGSFCHSLHTHMVLAATGLAVGNTLQALVGAALLGPLARFDRRLGRLTDVLKLALPGAVVPALVGATIGAATLCFVEGMSWEVFPSSWTSWWLNNALSNLVVAPFLLTWATLPPLHFRRFVLATATLTFLVLTSLVVFSQSSPIDGGSYPLTFVLFPLLIVMALAFGRRGATAAVLSVALTAFVVCRSQANNLSAPAFQHWLLLLQSFLGVMAVTTLALATAIHERRETESVLRRSEEALRDSEARYRSLVEDLEQGIYLKDIQLRYRAVNTPFCRGLNLLPEQIIGRLDHDLYASEQAKRYHDNDQLVLSENRRLEAEETVTVGPQSRVLRVIKTPVRDTTGQPIGVLGILWDVTEQRRLEAQLREAQQLEAVGQLAGGIAHEFNNLLTAILGNVGLVLANQEMAATDRTILLSVEQAGRRAADLTQQLLGFARRAVLLPVPLNLNSIVEETTGLIGRTLDSRIALEIRTSSNLWPVLADPGQMNQVLLNLCLNARDAMPQGGRLLIETANAVVDAPGALATPEAAPGEYVRMRVEDSGLGIPAEVRSRIFEPFFTTKQAGQGNGLGLAMVFGILKQHRGWVVCESEVGRGSRFDIYLPRGSDIVPNAETAQTPARAGSATILVVDDEAFIRKLARDVLERQGFRVLVAADGNQALTVYAEERSGVDVVVLDLQMPGLSGQETFLELRRLCPEIRVILSSGFTTEGVIEAPGVGFLSKPYLPKQLVAKINESLGKVPTA